MTQTSASLRLMSTLGKQWSWNCMKLHHVNLGYDKVKRIAKMAHTAKCCVWNILLNLHVRFQFGYVYQIGISSSCLSTIFTFKVCLSREGFKIAYHCNTEIPLPLEQSGNIGCVGMPLFGLTVTNCHWLKFTTIHTIKLLVSHVLH